MKFVTFVKGSMAVAAIGSLAVAAIGSLLVLLPENPFPTDERKPIYDIMPGDMVQWESMGALIFDTPKKVERVENAVQGMYVFVEGTGCGIPIEQVVIMS